MEPIILKDFMTPLLLQEALRARRWELTSAFVSDPAHLERLFLDGWEPFAVTTLSAARSEQVWLRRRVLVEEEPA